MCKGQREKKKSERRGGDKDRQIDFVVVCMCVGILSKDQRERKKSERRRRGSERDRQTDRLRVGVC